MDRSAGQLKRDTARMIIGAAPWLEMFLPKDDA
jgi:hypothetical protein